MSEFFKSIGNFISAPFRFFGEQIGDKIAGSPLLPIAEAEKLNATPIADTTPKMEARRQELAGQVDKLAEGKIAALAYDRTIGATFAPYLAPLKAIGKFITDNQVYFAAGTIALAGIVSGGFLGFVFIAGATCWAFNEYLVKSTGHGVIEHVSAMFETKTPAVTSTQSHAPSIAAAPAITEEAPTPGEAIRPSRNRWAHEVSQQPESFVAKAGHFSNK